MSDSATALLRALGLARLAAPARIEELRSRDWASATFAGTRHFLAFTLEGDGAEAAADSFLDGIEERDFDLRSHFVADVHVVSRESGHAGVRIALEALTIEAG